MPKNTWAGIVIAGFSLIMGFAMVWHIWWMAIFGTVGMIGAWIVYAFEKNKDYYVEIEEVEAIEQQHYNGLTTTKDKAATQGKDEEDSEDDEVLAISI
jgi:cytochrome o ubiquinol oxidase subunit 1